jgi:predicted short-subunit dehydrogenase-like oxidoreductase (DUF2520 family)
MNPNNPFRHVAVIGRGRLGNALAQALRDAGHAVEGPLGRGEAPAAQPDVLLLCVPDAEIAPLAAGLSLGPLVGHCSGASGLDALAPHEAFSLHPLMTLTGDAATGAQRLHGAGAAIAGTSDRALSVARALAEAVGLRPFELADEDRATYHAAATLASNFLITLECVAERLAADAGVPRELLLPLVRASVENWAALGAERALTGPIARGDEATVARQRAAIAEREPALLDLFDELCRATRELAGALR